MQNRLEMRRKELMQVVLVILCLLVSATSTEPGACKSDVDCSLNGKCAAGVRGYAFSAPFSALFLLLLPLFPFWHYFCSIMVGVRVRQAMEEREN